MHKAVKVWAIKNELVALKTKLYRLERLDGLINDIENDSGLFNVLGHLRLPPLKSERDFLRKNEPGYRDRIFEIEEWLRNETS